MSRPLPSSLPLEKMTAVALLTHVWVMSNAIFIVIFVLFYIQLFSYFCCKYVIKRSVQFIQLQRSRKLKSSHGFFDQCRLGGESEGDASTVRRKEQQLLAE